eukprot:1153450-Pelagomonas_calceolata.AAC.2
MQIWAGSYPRTRKIATSQQTFQCADSKPTLRLSPFQFQIGASKHPASLCPMGGGSLQHGQAGGGHSFRAHIRPDGSPHQHIPLVPPRTI